MALRSKYNKVLKNCEQWEKIWGDVNVVAFKLDRLVVGVYKVNKTGSVCGT